jgi:hypothetical protein
MSGDQITWALLAPVPQSRLASLADEYWRDKVGESEEFAEGREVIHGKGDYSAIIDRNPGSEYTNEVPLAKRISREVKQPVYVLYLNDDYADTDAVAVYENGRQTKTRRAPYAVARELGVNLPGDAMAESGMGASRAALRPVQGLVVAEGVTAEDVARALGMSAPPRGPVHIKDVAAGSIMYNEEVGSAPPVMRRLSKAFPDKHIYTLIADPSSGRFVAREMLGGSEVGTFESPAPPDSSSSPLLESVKGETNPRDIAARLGVPPGLLSFD